ncbi:MAG: amidohydrolase [Phascolarctobacterium sp.]|uniref:amidohydrolase n=1 Tax=Phascolarctobacterium sp. TaxID=2049039 RepID=UPI0026DD2E6B|nr:amidohydrolase [Phascolarctobacterium sp.]MDO4922106.1 amidohydrolase [Phascolarctobacterium sp.]
MASIWEQAQALREEMTARRRNLHRHPETGWTEFRTAGMVIKELRRLGYEVSFGAEVVDEASMMGVPSAAELEQYMARAVSEGADPELVKQMAGGKTGVVAVLRSGKPGKTVAFRFDMDCNDVEEERGAGHRPAQEGFASCHTRAMHACGHDGHVTIGLAAAKLIAANREQLAGTVKLIFQPAEEGVRGAYAMVNAGVVDDVDYLFGGHIGFKATADNALITMTDGFLATTKLDAVFKGVSAHAGAAPEQGRNALLAAAQAAISLNTISRHSQGSSRINVGVLNAGTGRNVVPDIASLKLETRGATTEINNFMVSEARRMLEACAAMYDVQLQVSMAGAAPACLADKELGHEVAELVKAKCGYEQVLEYVDMGGSEDCGYFMERVQQRGGQALYMMYGTQIAAGHHNSRFDFHEDCLWKAAATLTEIAVHFTNK